MRLLYLTAETYPTFRADVSVLFGKYLTRYGIYSDIVAGNTTGLDAVPKWGGGATLLCDVRGGLIRKHIVTLLHGIMSAFRADGRRYQAIQVRDMPVLGLFGLIAARVKGMKFIYWMSYPMSEGQIELARERGRDAGWMKFLYPWVRGRVGRVLLYRVVLPQADHIFVQSDRMLEDVAELEIKPSKMTAVPMGVDMEAIEAQPASPAIDPRLEGHKVLVYLGTLDRPRRIEKLFETLALVRKTIPEALLVLVGDTEDSVHRDWLRGMAQRVGVAHHVVWTGWLPMYEGWSYIRAANVAFSPIPRSYLLDCASPTKVPEYLALGVPVVCNDNPDQEKVIRESGAGKCVPYTPEGFAKAALDLLACDPQMIAHSATAGREYVKAKRNYDQIACLVAETYRKLI